MIYYSDVSYRMRIDPGECSLNIKQLISKHHVKQYGMRRSDFIPG